jgi:hypothetical protein
MDTRIEILLIIRADEWGLHQKEQECCLREHFTIGDCLRMYNEWLEVEKSLTN